MHPGWHWRRYPSLRLLPLHLELGDRSRFQPALDSKFRRATSSPGHAIEPPAVVGPLGVGKLERVAAEGIRLKGMPGWIG
jgi:hypothetical protein